MENQRIRTIKLYNLEHLNADRVQGFFEMPELEPCSVIPSTLKGFNYALSDKDHQGGVHFYIDDYQFERIWNRPDRYVDKLSKYECVLTPDFSLYLDMPIAMQIWNIYRSRLIGQYYQNLGLDVIPALSWSDKRSFEFCFDGLPKNSVVSISSVGVKRSAEARELWFNGVNEAIKRLRPKHIILYGGNIGFEFGDIEVTNYDNQVTNRMEKMYNGWKRSKV